MVGVIWGSSLDEPNITGYRIYRRLAHEEQFKLIGIMEVGSGFCEYFDTSPELKVGLPVAYWVTALPGRSGVGLHRRQYPPSTFCGQATGPP